MTTAKKPPDPILTHRHVGAVTCLMPKSKNERPAKTKPRLPAATGVDDFLGWVVGSVANNRATEAGDHHIDAVVTAGELVGQHFATQETFTPTIQAGGHFRTAGGNTGRYFIGAARIARIGDTPGDFNRRRRAAANRLLYAARLATACVGGGSHENQHGNRHAAHQETTETIHVNSLVVSGNTATNSVSATHSYRAPQVVQTVGFTQVADSHPVPWIAPLFVLTVIFGTIVQSMMNIRTGSAACDARRDFARILTANRYRNEISIGMSLRSEMP